MADNTILPIPSTTGDTIAADDIGGIKYQRVKVTIGADGTNDGDISSTNPMPITGTVLIDSVSNNQVSDSISGTDVALTTHSVITGETTAGGGSFVNVKVNPSGALAVDASNSAVSVTNFPATQAISAVSLPLPTGAATETTLSALNSKILTSAEMPTKNAVALPVRQAPQKYTDCSFSSVGSGLLSTDFTQIQAGSGMTISQSAGNLVIATGTTANSETVIRSVDTFNGSLTLREVTTLSQRIANNNFYIELVDIIGDGLAYTIVNATTVNVTKSSHGFTAQNVGQRMDLCAITGAAGIPMEGVIASIPGANTIQFTVAGWPASGSGTLSLTGYNKIEVLYTGTTATNLTLNTRRKGWQNTAATITINTSASGHMAIVNNENGVCSISDKTLVAGAAMTNRSSWDVNIPLPEAILYVQLRAKNGTTAPASTTTWTIGMVRVEDYIPSQVSLTSTRQQSPNNSLPVNIVSSASISTTGTSTVSGVAAHDAVISGNPVRIAGRALTANYTAVASGDVADFVTTLVGALITKPYAIPEQDWYYAAASGGITNTTDVVLSAAAGAGLRRYLTSISIQNASATVATEVVIKDGATVIYRGYVGTQALLNSVVNVTFPSPLKTTANTALNVACITTGAQVYVNAQGYTAP